MPCGYHGSSIDDPRRHALNRTPIGFGPIVSDSFIIVLATDWAGRAQGMCNVAAVIRMSNAEGLGGRDPAILGLVPAVVLHDEPDDPIAPRRGLDPFARQVACTKWPAP